MELERGPWEEEKERDGTEPIGMRREDCLGEGREPARGCRAMGEGCEGEARLRTNTCITNIRVKMA